MSHADPVTPASPAKLAAIVVLAIVFVIVLFVQFSGEDLAAVGIKKRTHRDSSPETAEDASPLPGSTTTAVRLQWPEISLEEVADFNPFAIPDTLQPKALVSPASTESIQPIQIVQSSQSSPAQISSEQALKAAGEEARIRAIERESRLKRIRATASDLQKQGVGMVVSTSAGAVARIGEQELRVGDVINGVLRIVEITPQGIVVEEAPNDGDAEFE